MSTAVGQAAAGVRGMLPPTLVTLNSLLPFSTVADVLAAAPQRSLEPVAPRLLPDADPPAVELPDGTVIPIPRALLK